MLTVQWSTVDKRRMCPNCRAFISSDDKVCPYCEAVLGARAVESRSPQDSLGGLIPHARFTTSVILLVNFGLYIATTLFSMKNAGGGMVFDIDYRTLVAFGGKYVPAIAGGEWWRLITAGFLHGSVLHILMNSWVLFDLGAQVEEVYGTSRYIVFYFIATVAGFMASTYWSPALSTGASAGIFGLIGAMLALGVRNSHTPMGAAVRSHYTQWAIFGLVMGFMPGIDNAAHIGGLAGGFLAAYVAGTPRIAGRAETAWKIAAVICLLVTGYSFAMMFIRFTGSYRFVL